MKILLVAYYFPPFNQIGAVRLGKFAKYMERLGHDVRVLTCSNLPLTKGLKMEISSEHVIRTKYVDVNWPVVALMGRTRIEAKGYGLIAAGPSVGLANRLKEWYRDLFHVPDAQIGWLPFAIRAGANLCSEWRPEVIYASAPPFTGLLVASSLSRKFGIPWVAEFRDLWTDNHNRVLPFWRRMIDSVWELRTIRSASGVVTVSEPLGDMLRKKYRGKRVFILPNGYDPEDYGQGVSVPDALFPEDCLNILYTGMLYQSRYDLVTFFDAIRGLDIKDRVRVHFFGRYLDEVRNKAKTAGVVSLVRCHDPVSHEMAVAMQKRADALLMFLWNDPKQPGVYSGKVFEYLGARRPILAIGNNSNVAAQLILERNAGVVYENVEDIKKWIRKCWETKLIRGWIPDLGKDVARGLDRGSQVKQLCWFLEEYANHC